MRTKWTILVERQAAAEMEAARIRDTLAGLDATLCNLRCAHCDTMLKTEGDFARHFAVSQMDEWNNNLNLGNCRLPRQPFSDKV